MEGILGWVAIAVAAAYIVWRVRRGRQERGLAEILSPSGYRLQRAPLVMPVAGQMRWSLRRRYFLWHESEDMPIFEGHWPRLIGFATRHEFVRRSLPEDLRDVDEETLQALVERFRSARFETKDEEDEAIRAFVEEFRRRQ